MKIIGYLTSIVVNRFNTLLLVIITFSFAFSFTFSVNASPLNDYSKVGSGQMNVLFWSVYHAEYYIKAAETSAPLTAIANQITPMNGQALKITYLRDIKQKDLIKATNEQWQHLKLALPNKAQWLEQLADIWPDINENDTLTLRVDENNLSHFYLSNKHHSFVKKGIISDPEFSVAFLAIWLSENTSRPDLRKKLLGLSPDK